MSSSRRNTFRDRLQERMGKLDAASLRKYLNIALNEKDFFEDIFDTLREGIIEIGRAHV